MKINILQLTDLHIFLNKTIISLLSFYTHFFTMKRGNVRPLGPGSHDLGALGALLRRELRPALN